MLGGFEAEKPDGGSQLGSCHSPGETQWGFGFYGLLVEGLGKIAQKSYQWNKLDGHTEKLWNNFLTALK